MERDIIFLREVDKELQAITVRISDETAKKIANLLIDSVMEEQRKIGHATDEGIEMVHVAHALYPQ
jgi:hypothetical protein